MEPGQKTKDYGYLKVTTRTGVSEKGRSKVLIVMHEEDRTAYEALITQDVLRSADCAVFTLKAGAEQKLAGGTPQELADFVEHMANIGEMRIVVAVVTERFLSDECFGRLVQVPEAIERKVAVLPIIVEPGLVDEFNNDEIFSGMQFLDRTSTDSTELGYEVKLRKYLDSLILTQTEVRDIRRHHIGHAFLSYRKKDRPLARKLMELIHDIRQDLAIWYDEFLTPGRHFDEEIENTIRQSDIFAMSMTPNMLEKPNYVEEHEYKTAVDSDRELLPVTMQDLEGADVEAVYPGLGECIGCEDTEEVAAKIGEASANFGGYSGDTETAEHKYYIALGYLNGIDAETDGARAEKLLREAADLHEGKFSKEAYRKLVGMYLNGAGVERSRQNAKSTQKELVDFCAEELERTMLDSDLGDLINEKMVYGGLFYDDNETLAATGIYEDAAEIIKKAVLESEAGRKRDFCEQIYELGSLAFTRLAVMYTKDFQREKAVSCVEAGIAVDKQMAETIGGDLGGIAEGGKDVGLEGSSGGAMDVAIQFYRLNEESNNNESEALAAQIRGDFRRGVELFLKNVENERKIIGLNLPENAAEKVRQNALSKIVGWYSRAANHAVMAGWYDEAREYCEKSLAAFGELGGELRLMGEPDFQGDVFWSYFHLSEIGRLTGDFGLMSDAAEKGAAVLEEIIEQSSAEKWRPYLANMRARIMPKARQAEARPEEMQFTEEGVPDFGENNPFGDAYVPYTEEVSDDVMDELSRMLDRLFSDNPENNPMNILNRKNAGDEDEDLPYDGEPLSGDECGFGDVTFDSDGIGEDYDLLVEDIEHAEFMMDCYGGEAREDFEYIRDKLKAGGYHVDAEAAGEKLAYVEERIRELGAGPED